MVPLLSETGQFYLDNPNNEYVTFAFSGDDEFANRTKNLLINCGAVRKTHPINETFSYCLVKRENLERALFLNFRAEIIQERQRAIDYTTKRIKDECGDSIWFEVEWDEKKLEELSYKRVEEFFATKVVHGDLGIYTRNQIFGEEYRVGCYQDE